MQIQSGRTVPLIKSYVIYKAIIVHQEKAAQGVLLKIIKGKEDKLTRNINYETEASMQKKCRVLIFRQTSDGRSEPFYRTFTTKLVFFYIGDTFLFVLQRTMTWVITKLILRSRD
jgi:hypothetical protein